MVSCMLCANFRPDTIGFGLGLGQCKVYEDYKAKGPSASALREALKKLGQVPDELGIVMERFWPGGIVDRNCERFEALA